MKTRPPVLFFLAALALSLFAPCVNLTRDEPEPVEEPEWWHDVDTVPYFDCIETGAYSCRETAS